MLSQRRKRPNIVSPCNADRYTQGQERIAEFSNGREGGLISLRTLDDGTLRVEVYACSERVVVVAPQRDAVRLAHCVDCGLCLPASGACRCERVQAQAAPISDGAR